MYIKILKYIILIHFLRRNSSPVPSQPEGYVFLLISRAGNYAFFLEN